MVPPSGQQFEISHGDQRATVVEVGGGIRTYSVGARPVLQPYDLDAMSDGAHGAVLVPWPNRIGDGRYSFDGSDHQLSLTEPAKHNAIHGLTRWRAWRATDHQPDSVTMTIGLHPSPGYPFSLDMAVAYSLGDDGLRVAATATNGGQKPCPYGFGQHPYLSPGPGSLDDCTLRFKAATRITTNGDRSLPTGSEPVAGTPFDFRDNQRIGGLKIDDAFTDLARDGDGRTWVALTGPDGHTVELWADTTVAVIQLYTGDTLAPDRRRTALAAEPMTCAANAFQSGERVQRLEPGQSTTTTWGTRLR